MINSIPPVVPAVSAQIEDVGCTNTEYKPIEHTCYTPGTDLAERAAQADNPISSGKLLCMLAEDSSVEIRMAVADNPNAPLVALTVLAQDLSDDLRYQLAENHNVDERILTLLAMDENPYVMCRAQKTLARLRHSAASLARPFFGVWTLGKQKRRSK